MSNPTRLKTYADQPIYNVNLKIQFSLFLHAPFTLEYQDQLYYNDDYVLTDLGKGSHLTSLERVDHKCKLLSPKPTGLELYVHGSWVVKKN